MLLTGGTPIVVDEPTLEEANSLARAATGISVDHTGSAGLAGLLHLARTGALDPQETVVVVFSGVQRESDGQPSSDPDGRRHSPKEETRS
jgi:hypothetical protein